MSPDGSAAVAAPRVGDYTSAMGRRLLFWLAGTCTVLGGAAAIAALSVAATGEGDPTALWVATTVLLVAAPAFALLGWFMRTEEAEQTPTRPIGDSTASASGDHSPAAAASTGGIAVAGDVSIGDQHIHAPPQAARPDWWLRDGAPQILPQLEMQRQSTHVGGDFMVTADVVELQSRVRGCGASGEWRDHIPSHGRRRRNAPGTSFHLGYHEDLDAERRSDPDVPEGDIWVEFRFWWQDEQRHIRLGQPLASFSKQQPPVICRW